ncbi:hypothetical protein ZIOFF_076005 [Zingiber officinale]|uniref:Uncharacterized protein n=1 Tax=Zingiber officinale TaxID=94328 RepID=A0A8J5BT19_ZINOF|nr:hypothetical protein ZIOFF_076005 [Zingiber officinale]
MFFRDPLKGRLRSLLFSLPLRNLDFPYLKQKVEGQDKDGAFKNKVFRQFPQNRPVADDFQNKPALSKDLLAGVFGRSSP